MAPLLYRQIEHRNMLTALIHLLVSFLCYGLLVGEVVEPPITEKTRLVKATCGLFSTNLESTDVYCQECSKPYIVPVE